jgi:D-lyxose ketol-isomerase
MKIITVWLVLFTVFSGLSHADNSPILKKSNITIAFDNAEFYGSDSVFLPNKAKDAVMTLLEYHGYPLFDGIKDKIFVTDYSLGRFTELGTAGILYENSQKNGYLLMDVILLPHQMLPEHWHVDGETSMAKREGLLVRSGSAYLGGLANGEDNINSFSALNIPKIHMLGEVEAKHVVHAKIGDFENLQQIESKHWLVAGEDGAVITEVATFSEAAATHFSSSRIKF